MASFTICLKILRQQCFLTLNYQVVSKLHQSFGLIFFFFKTTVIHLLLGYLNLIQAIIFLSAHTLPPKVWFPALLLFENKVMPLNCSHFGCCHCSNVRSAVLGRKVYYIAGIVFHASLICEKLFSVT